MLRKILLMTAGICLLATLGCTELRDLRRQNTALKGNLLAAERQRDEFRESVRLLSAAKTQLDEGLAKAKEKELSLTKLVGELEKIREERQQRIAELEEMARGMIGVSVETRAEGSFIVIENAILFASGEASLTPAAQQTLDSTVVAYLNKHAGQNIRIDGHTDGQPIKVSPFDDNYHLSVMRSNAVRKYLASRGIPVENMYIAGFGPNRPLVAPGVPTADVAENRRVEIFVVPAAGRSIDEILEQFTK